MSVFSCFRFSLMIWRFNNTQMKYGKAKEHIATLPVDQVLNTDIN